MDLTKAQYLLLKIQTFLEMGNGNELSRLETDLMKSYIIQLYDAVSSDEISSIEKSFNQFKPEPKEKVRTPEVITQPRVDPPVYIAPEPEVVAESQPVAPPMAKEIPLAKPIESKGSAPEELVKLFELSHPKEMDSRFSHVPVDDIASALGLNEKIFTLNVLFGGDRSLFENTCSALNKLNSFSEAAEILLHGPAQQYNWIDRENVKMAEHFIRTVARRYPHT